MVSGTVSDDRLDAPILVGVKISDFEEQALLGGRLKGDPGHLFGVPANLERGRRSAESARR
jgi:hypothetical protein